MDRCRMRIILMKYSSTLIAWKEFQTSKLPAWNSLLWLCFAGMGTVSTNVPSRFIAN